MLSFGHSIKQFDYLLWKMKMLFPLVGSFAFKVEKHQCGGKDYKALRAWTLSNRYLHHVFNDFYVENDDGRKKIAKQSVLARMTPISIAVWYMDDGFLHRKHSILLATNGFDEKSIVNIERYLINAFNLHPKREIGNTTSLRLNVEDAKRFLEIVKPHIPACMVYKIDPSLRTEHPIKSDEEIVRTLQECKELTRKRQPMTRASMTESEKEVVRDFVMEHSWQMEFA